MFIEDYITERLEKILGIKIKKFKCKRMGCYTYEGLSWVLLMYIIILPIVLYYPIVIGFHNLPSYIGILFISVYPILVMIFRKNTFSDNSIPSAQNPVYSGPNLVSGDPGYNPAYYWLFSFAIGGASTIWGFSMLNFAGFPVEFAVLVIFLGLIGQTVPLFPDYIEKISPVKLGIKKGSAQLTVAETKKSGIFMATLSIVTFLIIRFIAMTVQSQIFGIPHVVVKGGNND